MKRRMSKASDRVAVFKRNGRVIARWNDQTIYALQVCA